MIRKEKSMRKTIIVMTLAAVGFFALAGSRSAMAQATGTTAVPDTQNINYFTGGNNASPASTVINVTDPLEATSTGQPADICAMIYVFNNAEEMQECCGCLITEDGLLTVAVNGGSVTNGNTVGSLNTNPVQGASAFPTGVIRIVSAETNGSNQFEKSNVDTTGVCDATGGVYPYGQYGATTFGGAGGTPINGGATWANGTPLYNKGFSPANSGTGATMTLVGNTRAWATHMTNSFTETAFHHDPLTQDDANNLAETCGDVQNFGSGRGVCQCGSSD